MCLVRRGKIEGEKGSKLSPRTGTKSEIVVKVNYLHNINTEPLKGAEGRRTSAKRAYKTQLWGALGILEALLCGKSCLP